MGKILLLLTLLSILILVLLTVAGLFYQWRYHHLQRLAKLKRTPIRVQVSEKQLLGQYARFVLSPLGGKQYLPRFKAGDSVSVIHHETTGLRRRYSLANWHWRPRHYELVIKREPQGQMSGWLHDHVNTGDQLQLLPPAGSFHLSKTRGTRVLLAAGVGITPMRAMLQQTLSMRRPNKVVLFWSVRNSADLELYHHEFCQLEMEFADRVRYVPIVTQDSQWPGERRRLNVALLAEYIDPVSCAGFWICASPAMTGAIAEQLVTSGVAEDRIHSETFSLPVDTSTMQAEVILQPENRVLQFDSQPSLLHLFDEQGVVLEQDCRAGHCGACLLKIIEGEVSQVIPAQCPVAENHCLACISRPQGNLKLARLSG